MFIFIHVLGFIFKLRFPKNTTVRDMIKSRYVTDVLRSYRLLEQAELKCRNVARDVHFLETCDTNKLTTKILRFNGSARQLQSKEKTLIFRRTFLKLKFLKKNTCKYSNHSKKENLLSVMRCSISLLDFNHLIS